VLARGLAISMLLASTAAADQVTVEPSTEASDGARAEAEPHHLRIVTRRGPLHLWTPAGYDPRSAALVVFVHGYYANVDEAWEQYRLADAFAASGLNALFVACEAPRGPRARVVWPSLQLLVNAVRREVGDLMPRGRRIAVGHSGAHRTLELWRSHRRLDTMVLLDAGYNDLLPYRGWLRARRGRRLIHVADHDTRAASERLNRALPATLVIDGFEALAGPFDEARAARVLYVRSDIGHMAIVEQALAEILRTLRAPLLESGQPITIDGEAMPDP